MAKPIRKTPDQEFSDLRLLNDVERQLWATCLVAAATALQTGGSKRSILWLADEFFAAAQIRSSATEHLDHLFNR